MPASLICFFDRDGHFLKSQCGLAGSIEQDEPLKSFGLQGAKPQGNTVVRDTQEKPLSQTCRVAPGRCIRSFMRMPLANANGTHLGDFYVVDFKPRDWSQTEVEVLRDIAAAVESEVQLRLELAKRGEAEERYRELSWQLENQVRSRTAEVVKALRNARVVEDRFRILIERVPQAVAMFDTEMRYLVYSRQWAQDYRLEGDLTGRCHYDVFPGIPERWKEHHRRVFDGESLANEEDSFVREDGKREWLRWELVPWYDSEGTVGGLIMLTEVLTERRREQAELKAKYSELELITERLLETQKAAKLTHWSWSQDTGMVSLSPYQGQTEVQLPWESIRDDITQEDLVQIDEKLALLDSGAESIKVEFTLKNGRAMLAIGHHDGARVSGIVQDVSVLRSLEGQLRHSQKLESVGALVGGVAHDLNNILCSILLPAEMATTMVAHDHEVQEDLEAILDSGKRAKALVSQLLRFARRKRKATIQTFNVNESLTEVSKMLIRLLPSNVTLTTDLCEKTCMVRMDPSAFEQIVTNLVVNARDAMPRGGEIGLRTCCSDYEGGKVCVEVSDTGEGISNEIIDKVFEPFFTTKEVGRGTGLGLSVCQGIVREANGEITVDTSLGVGTRFRVALPPAPTKPRRKNSPLANSTELPKGRERVLLVEDDGKLRRTLVRLLTSLGYTVESFSSGEDALLYRPDSSESTPDILLLDVSLPRIDGRELACEMRLSFPNLPVILISGAELTQRGTWLVGARNYFLAKPFTRQALAEKLREALSA